MAIATKLYKGADIQDSVTVKVLGNGSQTVALNEGKKAVKSVTVNTNLAPLNWMFTEGWDFSQLALAWSTSSSYSTRYFKMIVPMPLEIAKQFADLWGFDINTYAVFFSFWIDQYNGYLNAVYGNFYKWERGTAITGGPYNSNLKLNSLASIGKPVTANMFTNVSKTSVNLSSSGSTTLGLASGSFASANDTFTMDVILTPYKKLIIDRKGNSLSGYGYTVQLTDISSSNTMPANTWYSYTTVKLTGGGESDRTVAIPSNC